VHSAASVIGKHVWCAFAADPQLQNVEIVGVVGDASLGAVQRRDTEECAVADPYLSRRRPDELSVI